MFSSSSNMDNHCNVSRPSCINWLVVHNQFRFFLSLPYSNLFGTKRLIEEIEKYKTLSALWPPESIMWDFFTAGPVGKDMLDTRYDASCSPCACNCHSFQFHMVPFLQHCAVCYGTWRTQKILIFDAHRNWSKPCRDVRLHMVSLGRAGEVVLYNNLRFSFRSIMLSLCLQLSQLPVPHGPISAALCSVLWNLENTEDINLRCT
jgi:hypothetical protein